MPDYRIIGVIKETKDDVELRVTAASPANAKVKAELDEIIVTEVVEWAEAVAERAEVDLEISPRKAATERREGATPPKEITPNDVPSPTPSQVPTPLPSPSQPTHVPSGYVPMDIIANGRVQEQNFSSRQSGFEETENGGDQPQSEMSIFGIAAYGCAIFVLVVLVVILIGIAIQLLFNS